MHVFGLQAFFSFSSKVQERIERYQANRTTSTVQARGIFVAIEPFSSNIMQTTYDS